MDRHHGAICNQRGGVVDARARVFGKAHHDVRALHFLAHTLQGELRLQSEPAVEQEILGWIPRQGELRKEDEVGAQVGVRVPGRRDDPPSVAVHVPDEQVELCQGDPEGLFHALRRRLPAATRLAIRFAPLRRWVVTFPFPAAFLPWVFAGRDTGGLATAGLAGRWAGADR